MSGFKKKNLIALALAAAVAVSGFGVYRTQAAGRIDADQKCFVSVSAEKVDSTNPFAGYAGTVTVDFYKVADMDLTGKYTSVKSGVSLDELSSSDVKAATLDSIAEDAYKAFKLDTESPESPNKTVTFDLSDLSSASAEMDRGLYLFVPQTTNDDRYEYTFKYSLVSVPTSQYIASTKVGEDGAIISDDTASDAWLYTADLYLKPEATARYGNLQIVKSLNTYNESLGTASFVYEVVGTRDDEIVFDNVYTMNFDSAGENEILVENIPGDAVVTVTEVYSGASYSVAADTDSLTAEIIGNETVSVEFVNDYDDRLISGGMGIENTFVKNDDAGYVWVDPNASTEIDEENIVQESEEQ